MEIEIICVQKLKLFQKTELTPLRYTLYNDGFESRGDFLQNFVTFYSHMFKLIIEIHSGR